MVKHELNLKKFPVGGADEYSPCETPESVLLDLSLEFGADIVVQDSDQRSMRLECRKKISSTGFWR